jgi:MFS transporter, DHA3 family, macrolide efflux protein
MIPPKTAPTFRLKGMPAFFIVWAGQSVSLLGTAMTSFAMSVWAFQNAPENLRATVFSMLMVAYFLPLLVLSPFAGAIVDRSDRKWLMIVSDLGAGLATMIILVLYLTGNLQIWHLFITNAIEGIFQTFQWPAYSAAITLMVDKKHYSRTSALNQLAGNTSNILAPLIAGAVIGLAAPFGILSILVFDVITFMAAVFALLLVFVPHPAVTEEGRSGKGSLFKEALYGFRYIWQRPGLLGLQITYLLGNFFSNLSFTLLAPMILSRTASNTLVFGGVQTAGAVGGVLGGIALSLWGGPKRKSAAVTLGWALVGMLGMLITGLGQSLPVWAVGVFLSALFVPLIDASNQAIWQVKVAPDVQGRVFSIRRMIAWLGNPLGAALAGPLADFVLEPGMQPGGELLPVFGRLVGSGPGAGMALVFIYAGLATLFIGLAATAIPAIYLVEERLPDNQSAEAG